VHDIRGHAEDVVMLQDGAVHGGRNGAHYELQLGILSRSESCSWSRVVFGGRGAGYRVRPNPSPGLILVPAVRLRRPGCFAGLTWPSGCVRSARTPVRIFPVRVLAHPRDVLQMSPTWRPSASELTCAGLCKRVRGRCWPLQRRRKRAGQSSRQPAGSGRAL
jgi:hypothetical protein